MSDERLSAVQALSRVMADVQTVRKDDRNQQQGYSFRGIDAVVNAVGPALRKYGVVVMPTVEEAHYQVVPVGQKQTPTRECTLRVRFTFYGPAGDHIEAVTYGEALDHGDKATPKAHSVAYRIALLQALCIPTDEPDTDQDSFERSPTKPERPAKRTQKSRGREADQWEARTDEDRQAQRKAADEVLGEDSVKLLRAQIWAAAQKAGIGTKEQAEQDFAQSTDGLILTDAGEGELKAYLGVLQARLDETKESADG